MSGKRFPIQPRQLRILFISLAFGFFAAFLSGIHFVLGHMEESLKGQMNVIVFFQPSVTADQAKSWLEGFKQKDSEILSSTYVSKEEAYQEALKDPALARSLSLLKENPLPSSLSLSFSTRAWLERDDMADSFRSTPEIQEIRWDAHARDSFRLIHSCDHWLIRLISLWLALFLAWVIYGLFRLQRAHLTRREITRGAWAAAAGGIMSWLLWTGALHFLRSTVSLMLPPLFSIDPLLIGFLMGLSSIAPDEPRA